MNSKAITLALVEDDPSLRETLSAIIGSSPRWSLVSAFSTAEEALEVLPSDPPDIVLMDIQLPGMSGIACVARLRDFCPEIQILMVTVYDNNDRIFEALAAGAAGYLLKRDAPEMLLSSLEDLHAGGSPMSSAIARKVVQHFQSTPDPKLLDYALTPREFQILEELVKGSLYKEIAAELEIGVETVRTHLRNIYAKLHVRTRTEAVVKYLRH